MTAGRAPGARGATDVAADVDVVVVGAGPAGSATAIALRDHGVSVAVVDAAPARRFRIGETVPPDVRAPLARLGAWASFAADGHLPTAATGSAWGEPALAWRDGFTHPLGGGWHLDRARFEASLAAEAGRRGAELVTGRVGAVDRTAAGWSVAVGGGRRVRARFVVDAGGRAGAVARRCGAVRVRVDRQVAVFAVVPVPAGAPGALHTLVEAVPGGWWYAARVPGDRAVVALFTDADLARGPAARPAAWHAALVATDHVAGFLGDPPAPPPAVRTVSAGSHCLVRPCGPGWLAAGDAATAWDPLASAGIVHALRSGTEAADAVVGHLGGDAGAADVYAGAVLARFTRYLGERRERYLAETRWPSSPYWRRRHGGPGRRRGTARVG